ncbi:hypothetical protein TNCT_158551 [Trichonephila clavata]|uniref:Uncharacterized protein n=1 Tax=Trichonephila clavata TaxID=2740835 RepID=A0A8X6KIF3_TRICU|nr:hypothetical protein TNCT_158551 [Trichonephila clavata]
MDFLRYIIKQAFLQEDQICLTTHRGGTENVFLQQVLPELLDAAYVPPSLCSSMWYQHDWANPPWWNPRLPTSQRNLWTMVHRPWWPGFIGSPDHWIYHAWASSLVY